MVQGEAGNELERQAEVPVLEARRRAYAPSECNRKVLAGKVTGKEEVPSPTDVPRCLLTW